MFCLEQHFLGCQLPHSFDTGVLMPCDPLQRRTASARKAFLQLLGNTQPVLQPESTWEELRPLLSADPRFGEDVLDDTRRMALFEDYTAELRTAREFRLRRGEETFKVRPYLLYLSLRAFPFSGDAELRQGT